MIWPVGDDQVVGGSKPLFAYGFIALNILIYLLFEFPLSGGAFESFVTTYGALPGEISVGVDMFTLFTSMFLHGSMMHLVGNMLFLWVFADNIEATIGNIPFLLFYIGGGLAAHLGHIMTDPTSMIPTVGASGAISAALGAYLVMFPSSRIKVLVIIFFRSFYVPALLFLGFWILQQLFSGFTSIGGTGGGVAWWAHIGGFAFGAIAGILFRKMYHPVRLTSSETPARV